MTGFIIGAVVGGTLSLFISACCVAAGREDAAVEKYIKEIDHVR